MEVEEDPSSQFVDFTNATALEQFVSDAEQALIAWHLAGKGHASAEALAASHSAAQACYSHVLEFEQPPRKPDGSVASSSAATHKVKYALTLFLSRGSAAAPASSKQWQRGREHFTPTMLAIADAGRDLVWGHGFATDSVDASAIASDADRWFGVDEFLLVTRTSLPSEREKKLLRQQQQALARRPSRNALAKDGVAVVYPEDDVVPPTLPGAAFDGTMDTNEAHLLLSAIHLALLNCNCTIPAFVPVQNVSKGTWLGTAVPGSTGNVSINFETDSTPEANSNQSYISGLLDFFRLKLQLPAHIEDNCRVTDGGDAGELSVGTWVSAAFCYSWHKDEDPREAEKQPMEWRFSNLFDMQSDMKQLSQTLFGRRDHIWGSSVNPIAQIDLTAVWPNLREGIYVDNAVHSTLDPETAPEWMLDVSFDNKSSEWLRGFHDPSQKPTMPLSRVIANLVQAYSNAREISRDVLVSELAPTVTSLPPTSSSSTTETTPPSSTTSESSSRLPGTIPAARAAAVFGSAIGSITSSIVSAATWKGADVEEIQRMIGELFDGDDGAGPSSKVGLTAKLSIPSTIVHSTPVGELVSVLASRMGQLQGVSAMALLWVEFVKALREQWYQQRLLPLMRTREGSEEKFDGSAVRALDALFLLESTSMDLPSPDFRQSLLHQKLQLLNNCILRQAEGKKSDFDQPSVDTLRRSSGGENVRADTLMKDLTAFTLDDENEEDESLSDDEFFDSVELHDTGVSSTKKPTLPASGVRRPIPGMVSLSTGLPLMEPITQVAVPMTEDVAKQQQELLSRLGVGVESTMLRQRLQSAALVSDMQAFKAANPGSCLADFIRWYSPKDWIVPDPLSANIAYENLPSEGRDVWWFENKGMLSERMRSSSGSRSTSSLHLWHQMWESSAPTPVNKQKRLFDPVGESEKLFHYLETISPHEMFHQMLVGAIASCYAMLDRACLPLHTKEGPTRISTIDASLRDLRDQCDRAVSLLDEACAESQLAIPTGRDQKFEQEKAKGQLQVAFEMALDACRKMARTFEEVEMMMSQASALLQYFSSDDTGSIIPDVVDVVDLLLATDHKNVSSVETASIHRQISSILRNSKLRGRLASLVLHNPSSREPVHREYVIRCICPRPFLDDSQDFGETEDEEDDYRDSKVAGVQSTDDSALLDLLDDSPVVVNRMYASFTKETVRFALTLAESEF